ncbi:predicted protein [Streptomyces sp. SPB78]|nr:predicted protein [Streptomyces sp. SPB78]
MAERTERERLPRADPGEPPPARDEHGRRPGRQERRQLPVVRRVVEHEQEPAPRRALAVAPHQLVQVARGRYGFALAERAQELREHRARGAGRAVEAAQLGEEETVGEGGGVLGRRPHGERRLADARHPGHEDAARYGRGVGQAPRQSRQFRVPSDEVALGRGQRRRHGGRLRLPAPPEVEGAAEHRLVRRAERLARVDAELFGEDGAALVVRLERVGLPAAPVQRRHELRPYALAHRVLGDEPGQFGGHEVVPAEFEVRVDARLQGEQAFLLQRGEFRLAQLLRRVGERGSAPQPERVAEQPGGLLVPLLAERGAPRAHQRTEVDEVDTGVRGAQRVAGRLPHDLGLVPELLAPTCTCRSARSRWPADASPTTARSAGCRRRPGPGRAASRRAPCESSTRTGPPVRPLARPRPAPGP